MIPYENTPQTRSAFSALFWWTTTGYASGCPPMLKNRSPTVAGLRAVFQFALFLRRPRV